MADFKDRLVKLKLEDAAVRVKRSAIDFSPLTLQEMIELEPLLVKECGGEQVDFSRVSVPLQEKLLIIGFERDFGLDKPRIDDASRSATSATVGCSRLSGEPGLEMAIAARAHMSAPEQVRVLSLAKGRDKLQYCNSYNKLPNIIALAERMDPRDWLKLLGEHWAGCDNIAQCMGDLWRTPFAELAKNPNVWRQAIMTEVEHKAWKKLPTKVAIFRGCYAFNKHGLSWSLSRDVAKKFPMLHRYRAPGRQPLLITAMVRRDEILALMLDRDEGEIITWLPKAQSTSRIRAIEVSGTSIGGEGR